jgi:hypothetical protein
MKVRIGRAPACFDKHVKGCKQSMRGYGLIDSGMIVSVRYVNDSA